ncbi:alpha/beta-hydrolase [Gautieria morchelliformis]|nr:alpha/beta-hydrolase [Gautieria morchelliformis]
MPFTFRHQPFKTFYLTGTVIVLIFVRLPFWTLRNAFPSLRPRPKWSLGRSILVSVYRVFLDVMFDTTLLPNTPIAKAAEDAEKTGFVWVDATPTLVVGEVREKAAQNGVEAVRTAGFWFGTKKSDGKVGQKADDGEKVFYHFHGGGFVMGSAHPSTGPVKVCFDGLLQYTSISRIFALEYRLCVAPPFGSENAFPAALIDAVAGYRYLVEDIGFKPENIIVSGDSSGGNLACALVRYLLVNKLPNLPGAGALLMHSPTVDWACTHVGPESSMVKNSRSDFVHAIFSSGYSYRALRGKLPADEVATNPWISPASLKVTKTQGLFAGFPQTMIVCGGAEMTLDPMRTLRDRILADIGAQSVTYLEVPDSTHDFFTAKWHEPERTNAMKDVGTWIDQL